MASVMILFYLEDKKIRYFEIYGAFEKMGVFDNSWQKQVLQILGNIDDRLANIGSQLSHLSDDFEILFDKSDLIISELKQIENGVFGNNILQAVTAYQTWQINKNTKSKN
jgi:enamine deaminase RidA (YjgF/YER057c/UK114 family)